MALTVQDARQLVRDGGFVRSHAIDARQHANTAKIISLEGDSAIIKPRGHGKTEKVPLSKLTPHRSKTAEVIAQRQARLNGSVNGNGHHADQPDPWIAVIAGQPHPLFWIGRGFTRDITKAKRFDFQGGVNRCVGALRNHGAWASLAGTPENFKAVRLSVALTEYMPRNPLQVQAERVLAEGPKLAAPVPAPLPAPAPVNRVAEHFDPTPPSFEVDDCDFRELQAAYREFESAASVTRDAYDRVQSVLSRISKASKLGLEVARCSNGVL